MLDWEHRLKMVNLCRRLNDIGNGAPWMRCARFTLRDRPTVFSAIMVRPRTYLITELDVSLYVRAKPKILAEALSICTNLKVLRCVHTLLAPDTMVLLLRDKLRRLECLHWSAWEPPLVIDAPAIRAGVSERSCDCAATPPNLKTMYLEVTAAFKNFNFVCSVLEHCHALKSLHLHECSSEIEVPHFVTAILGVCRDASGGKFEDFIFTTDRSPKTATLLADPKARNPDLFSCYDTSVDVCGGIFLKMTPKPRQNCVTLGGCNAMCADKAPSHSQLTLLLNEWGDDAIARLCKLWTSGKLRHLKALTLMVVRDVAAMLSNNLRNQALLCNLIRSCVAISELNLSAFHFGPHFDWSSVIATGGLDNIRSLALAACALCKPGRLQLLCRASFKLRDLDVRSFPQDVPICGVCARVTTCDHVTFAPLRWLSHLERLTLCDLPHVRNLDFLFGCTSIRELRLRNLGTRFNERLDMAPIISVWPQLSTLTYWNCTPSEDFRRFCGSVPVAPSMKQLCLGVLLSGRDVDIGTTAPIGRACPAVDVWHLHARDNAGNSWFALIPTWALIQAGGAIPYIVDASWLSTADIVRLCKCANYIGLIAPHGAK
ncbi:hypothetical protein HPB50_007991 [Hyalomma asiaticum]|uniref:Uncharacterized protein n=1 Tax=Hyalomma asiaticum TaxID=266040 RepID=A0ACB7RTU5_HYAAI|nr:hypothetical protein HPB50_007991 [Hyalomma asiaticum]